MTINRNNYEEYFLLYVDRELGRDEQVMVEDYVRLNPDLEREFNLLKQTTAIPPVMVFEGKEALLKEEKKRRIFPLFWMRIAATLIILLAGGWFLLVITGKTKRHAENITASNQMAIHQDGNKTKVPEPSVKPANQGNPENLQKDNPVAVTSSANGQKEDLVSGTKTKSISGKKTNPGVGTNPSNGHYIKPDPADNPEKNSPEPNEVLDPSTKLPSTKVDISDIAQNNKLPQINAANPSTVNPPSLSSLKTAGEADRFGGQGHQPSSERPSTINYQPSTIPPPSTVNRQPSTNPDNSQSILVFNNNNKTVTGFFKKLLAKSGDEQVTADNRKRKIKISVFQFNVSK
jgi:hypothetical protein